MISLENESFNRIGRGMISKRGCESIGNECTFDFKSKLKYNSQSKLLKWSKGGGEGKMLPNCIYNSYHITLAFAHAYVSRYTNKY